jgi:hypothetical protein
MMAIMATIKKNCPYPLVAMSEKKVTIYEK